MDRQLDRVVNAELNVSGKLGSDTGGTKVNPENKKRRWSSLVSAVY